MNKEQRRKLIEHYPYLLPRNIWTDEIDRHYDYDYICGEVGIPGGWFRLFLLCCKNIKPLILAEGKLDVFRFGDIKEKYGRLDIHTWHGSESVHTLITMYSALSKQICFCCGKPARYESYGWIAPWCETCVTRCVDTYHKIYEKSQVGIYECSSLPNGSFQQCETYYSLRKIKKEYNKCSSMTEEEFYRYLIQ